MGQSVTDNYDALLSTTARNARGVVEDLASTSIPAWYYAKKQDNYHVVDNLGYQIQQPLMTALNPGIVYGGFDNIDPVAFDGMDTALFDWRSVGGTVIISGEQERKNTGENAITNLLAVKMKQTSLGMLDTWDRGFLQGNGMNSATAITTALTNATTSSVFIEPLAKLVAKSGTGTVGGINSSNTTGWQNQYTQSGASTYEGHLQEWRSLFNTCSKGPGGAPDWILTDQPSYELIERALGKYHHNNSYTKADVPFTNYTFKGCTVVWDQYVPDVENGTIAAIPVTTSGTAWFLNSQFMHIYVDKQNNFTSQGFMKPYNQDAKSSLILWRGAVTVSNRRKQGVLAKITNTATS